MPINVTDFRVPENVNYHCWHWLESLQDSLNHPKYPGRAKTFKVLTTVSVGIKPDAILYDPASRRVFVANADSDDLTAIDVDTDTVVGTIRLGGKPEFAVTDQKGHLYVNLENKNQIEVVESQTMTPIARYNLGPFCEGPTGLAIDLERNRLFSTCASGTMVAVDSANGKILDTVPIGKHSDAAAYDAGANLVLSSNGEGTLTVVGLSVEGHYQAVQTLKTKLTARTMALDPLTHHIYLAAAEVDGFDPPTDINPEPRPHIKPDTFMILTVAPEVNDLLQ